MEQQRGGFVDGRGQAAHLIVRFASDAESDHLLAPHSSELQSRLCARILREFCNMNLRVCSGDWAGGNICTDTNLVAHWANLGYVEEVVIHNHILQSLIHYPKLCDHQTDALIPFKLAGATFRAYAEALTHQHFGDRPLLRTSQGPQVSQSGPHIFQQQSPHLRQLKSQLLSG